MRRPEVVRGGFVLGFVVLLLFAVAVMGATGYLVVNTEFQMARYGAERAEAAAIARAGLQRFVAEQLGALPDTVQYAIGDGVVTVTARKLFARDTLTDMVLIRAEAEVSDLFTQQIPATRVVEGYAIYHRRPLRHRGVVIISENEIETDRWYAEIHGVDSSTAFDCSGGGASTIPGAIALNTVDENSGDIEGDPDDETWGSYDAMYDSLDIRWDVLSDPSFPVDFEDAMPNFAALPPDSFPVIRFNGSKYFNWDDDGRGVLIVTGEYDASWAFDWSGIILAGAVDRRIYGQVRGMLIGGLAGPNPGNRVEHRGQSYYYSCNVYAANESLSYLELLENTVYEVD